MTKHNKPFVLILIGLVTLGILIFAAAFMRNKQTPGKNPAATRLEQQLPTLKEKAEADPNNYLAAREYAHALYATNNNEQAITEYLRVVDLNPSDARSLNNLGNLYRKESLYEEATQQYEQSITVDPTQVNAYVNLAHLYIYDMQQPQEGFAVFERAVAAHPDNVDLLIMLANVYQQQDMPDEARDTYQQILQLQPDNATALSNLEQL